MKHLGKVLSFLFLFFFMMGCSSLFKKHTDMSLHYVLQPGPGDSPEKIKEILFNRLTFYHFDKSDVRIGGVGSNIDVSLDNWDTSVISKAALDGIITSTGGLEFWETYENGDFISCLVRADSCLSRDFPCDSAGFEPPIDKGDTTHVDPADVVSERERVKRRHPLFYRLQPFIDQSGRPIPGPIIGRALIRDTALVLSYLKRGDVTGILQPNAVFRWIKIPQVDSVMNLICLRKGAQGFASMHEVVVTEAEVEFNNQTNSPNITLTMNGEDAERWAKLTGDNIGKSIAIVFDGQVFSYPMVQSQITGGMSQITGNFTNEEARSIVALLKAGVIKGPLSIVRQEIITKGR